MLRWKIRVPMLLRSNTMVMNSRMTMSPKQRKVLSAYSVQRMMVLLSDYKRRIYRHSVQQMMVLLSDYKRRMWVKDQGEDDIFVQEQVNVVEQCTSSCVHIFVINKQYTKQCLITTHTVPKDHTVAMNA
jgi:hypothetical protein